MAVLVNSQVDTAMAGRIAATDTVAAAEQRPDSYLRSYEFSVVVTKIVATCDQEGGGRSNVALLLLLLDAF